MLSKKKLSREPQVEYEESRSTKERILHVAEELFAQKGFGGTRTRDIAEQAGINISTLHFHWKSKEELYTAVYQQLLNRREQLSEEIFALLTAAPASPESWQETIQAVVEKMFTFFRAREYAARLETHYLLAPEVSPKVLDRSQAGSLLMSVAERLRSLMPEKLTRQLDVELTIMAINAFLREYFTNPAAFGRLLGERSPEALEKRVKRHVRQMVARLYDLM